MYALATYFVFCSNHAGTGNVFPPFPTGCANRRVMYGGFALAGTNLLRLTVNRPSYGESQQPLRCFFRVPRGTQNVRMSRCFERHGQANLSTVSPGCQRNQRTVTMGLVPVAATRCCSSRPSPRCVPLRWICSIRESAAALSRMSTKRRNTWSSESANFYAKDYDDRNPLPCRS